MTPRLTPTRARSRLRIGVAVVLVILAGVASRTVWRTRPPIISKHLGDVLWGLMFYLLVLLARPGLSRAVAVAGAFVIAAASEFLKLYHAPWIESVRANHLAGPLLGSVFQWGNIAAYAVGALVGMGLDRWLRDARLVIAVAPRTDSPAGVK